MAKQKAKKKTGTADRKAALGERVTAAKTVFGKNKGKAGNDPKRRLALKKLKRAQRSLRRVVKAEKAKEAKPAESTG